MGWKALLAILVGYIVLTFGIGIGWIAGRKYERVDTAALLWQCGDTIRETRETFETIQDWLGDMEREKLKPPQFPSVTGGEKT